MKKLIIILTAILYVQMCGNPARRTGADQETDGENGSPIERVFISDRLQDSLENFLNLIDTDDVFMVCLKPGVYRSSEDTSHRKDVVTISFWVDDKDTNVIFAGRHAISAPINVGTGTWTYNETVVGAKHVNKTIIAVNSNVDISLGSILDSVFLQGLSLELYEKRKSYMVDVTGGIVPYLKSYIINGDILRLEFSNENDMACLDTVVHKDNHNGQKHKWIVHKTITDL